MDPFMDVDEMRTRHVLYYRKALSEFISSSSPFRVLYSLPSPFPPPPKTLYILDSSFNPPTLAHLHIALSALTSSNHLDSSRLLLLLLATQNADKAPQPAAFEQRINMMELLAREILAQLPSPSTTGVDIGVTNLPYFVDKAQAIASSGVYGTRKKEAEQVHLIGYDTLTRILDPKYYPPKHNLDGLVPFLERHRLRVAYRSDDKWGSRMEQEKYVSDIGEGSLDGVGGKRAWVSDGRIALVEGRKEGEDVISSTKVREAVKKKDWDGLRRLVTTRVGGWIRDENLYVDD